MLLKQKEGQYDLLSSQNNISFDFLKNFEIFGIMRGEKENFPLAFMQNKREKSRGDVASILAGRHFSLYLEKLAKSTWRLHLVII